VDVRNQRGENPLLDLFEGRGSFFIRYGQSYDVASGGLK